MVLTWNTEPSKDLARASVSLPPSPSVRSPSAILSTTTPRFAYDGAPRTHNFLNGLDGQLHEARPHMASVDTNTHTRYNFQGAGASGPTFSMASEVARSLSVCASMKSTRAKSATSRSLVASDTRYAHLRDPHEDHVGAGAYAIERAKPGIGTLPLDSALAATSPQRDPYRMNSSFLSPERPLSRTWIKRDVIDAVYISPEYVPGSDNSPAWAHSKDQRPDATDWRYSSRIRDAKRDVSPPRDASAAAAASPLRRVEPAAPRDAAAAAALEAAATALRGDCASRPVELAVRAQLKNPSGVAFTSKEPRMLPLPNGRCNDVRTQRHQAATPDESSHLGPGAYLPYTSMGGARPRTYRIFTDPHQQWAEGKGPYASRFGLPPPGVGGNAGAAASSLPTSPRAVFNHGAAVLSSSRSRGSHQAESGAGGMSTGRSMSSGAGAGAGGLNGSARGPGPGSSAFTGTFRAHKSGMGGLSWRTDSTLVRH